jgi:plasmid stability protein
MRTLYLRNVPDEVVERLERLAARDATSLGAVAVRELTRGVAQSGQSVLLGVLPDLDVDAGTILDDVEAARADR